MKHRVGPQCCGSVGGMRLVNPTETDFKANRRSDPRIPHGSVAINSDLDFGNLIESLHDASQQPIRPARYKTEVRIWPISGCRPPPQFRY